jgi:hypothetical protein
MQKLNKSLFSDTLKHNILHFLYNIQVRSMSTTRKLIN